MDRSISIWTVAAAILWALGFTLVVLDLAFAPVHTGFLGLYFTCGGGVATICRAIQVTHRAQRNAFELGRDWATAQRLR